VLLALQYSITINWLILYSPILLVKEMVKAQLIATVGLMNVDIEVLVAACEWISELITKQLQYPS